MPLLRGICGHKEEKAWDLGELLTATRVSG